MSASSIKAAGTGAVGAIALMAAILTPYTSHWEGTKLVPYKGIDKKWTVCTGETRVEMRLYTSTECNGLLQKAIVSDFAPPVLKCVPTLSENVYAFASLVDAAYNAGPAAACRSPMAKFFLVRNWRAGCEAFAGWYVTVNRVPVRGLANRRSIDKAWSERSLCLKGV